MTGFQPPRLLRGPHVQSVVARVGLRRARVRRRAQALIEASSDVLVDTGDGVRLLLHVTAPTGAGNGRVAVLLHGWEGSGMATYVLSASMRLRALGYRIVRLNLRDHGPTHHLNEELFHSCRLAEVIGAVGWVQRQFEGESLSLIGSSLGGNFALRIALAAPAAGIDIRRVVAICPVLDPEHTMHALDRGPRIYQWYFMRRWRESLRRKQAAFPRRYDFSQLERFGTLGAMTDYFVRHYTEFPDLETYLHGYALTGERLRGLAVPARVLLAADDPVIPVADLDRIARPDSLKIDVASAGGHCGFVADYRLSSWSDRFIVDALSGPDDTFSDIRSRVA